VVDIAAEFAASGGTLFVSADAMTDGSGILMFSPTAATETKS
jgi:hypothetical protein